LHGAGGRWWIAGLVAAAALVWPAARASELGLAWNPAPGAAGYRVLYGTAPTRLDRQIEVRGATRVVLRNLAECTTWYASVTAYNAAGESAPSPVVSSWPRPAVHALRPRQVTQGDQLGLTVVGTNFAPATRIEVDSAGLYLDVVAQTCGQLDVELTAEPTAAGRRPAQVGTFELRVRSPEGLMAAGPFEIAVDPSRFDVNRSVPSTVGRLDGDDAVWIARRFSGRDGDGVYDPDLDFDGDGWIDGQELAWIGSNFGQCWSGSAWTHSACPPVPGASP